MTTITRERLALDESKEEPLMEGPPEADSVPTGRRKRLVPEGSLQPSKVVPSAIVVLLSIVSVAGFGSAVNGWSFLTSAALGIAGAALVTLLAHRARLYVGETIATSVVALFVLGGPATGGVPLPDNYRSFADGLIHGWADLLSSAPPADLTPSLRVLPYTIVWIATALGLGISRRADHPIAPLAGPGLGLIVTSLLTVEDQTVAITQGVAFSLGAIVLGMPETDRRQKLRVIPLLVVLALSAPFVAPKLPYADQNDRLDLRRLQDRPWDPLDVPSPLVTLKASLKDGRSNDVAFTVTSSEPITRWPLAVLGHYDGLVWSVANPADDGSNQFRPVDSVLPLPPDEIDRPDPVSYQIQVGALGGVWVPSPGWPIHVEQGSSLNLRFNDATGTLAAVDGLSEGEQVTLTAFRRTELSSSQLLAATTVTNDEDAELELVPPAVRNVAGDVFEGVDAGSARAVALSQSFTLNGFYDHGRTSRPGHSLARIDEFLADPDRMVGYAETYAAAAGVIARIGGVPSRVVVGYVIPEDRYQDHSAEILAQDITAWIEVETVEHGWVPLTVTPDRAREPQDEKFGVTINDVAIPDPPPPPPPPPEPQPSARPAADQEKDKATEDDDDSPNPTMGLAKPALVSGIALGVPTLILGSMGGLVVLLKAKLRHRRRTADFATARVAGAWDELLDRCREAGVSNQHAATASETVSTIVRSGAVPETASADLQALADQLDRATFHPTAVSDQSADDAWDCTDRTVARLATNRSRWERLCLLTDPRPVLFRPTGRRYPTRSKSTGEIV